MVPVTGEEPTTAAYAALAEGRWDDARRGFETALQDVESADACFGLAVALWWMGENYACVDRCSRTYTLLRRSGDVEHAAHCAVWLAITFKANFANFAAANGWIGRAERLLEPLEPGPLHGWVWVARAYRMTDLERSIPSSSPPDRMTRTYFRTPGTPGARIPVGGQFGDRTWLPRLHGSVVATLKSARRRCGG